uniref:Clc-like protein 2 n=1 Tax=Parascaris univalens TaxID=6257 RepID=A0A915BB32_PARUN
MNPKAALQIPAFILILIGVILIFIALATPSWQVVYARELQQWIKSGLWMHCQTRPSGMLSCTYTFTKNDYDFYTSAEVVNIRTPAFFEWQHDLLYAILSAQLLALFAMVSFCISHAESAHKSATKFFSVAVTIAAMINLGANVSFQVFAHMVEYRFYHVSVSGIYEKHIGYSYYLHLIGSLMLLLALFLSLAYIITDYRLRSTPVQNQQTFASYQ